MTRLAMVLAAWAVAAPAGAAAPTRGAAAPTRGAAAPTRGAAAEVVLAVIDEESEKALGWPLKPAALAEALEKIEAAAPKAVALKFFVESDDARLASVLRRYRNVYLQCAGAQTGSELEPELLGRSLIAGGDGADFDDRARVVFPPKGLAEASAGVGFVHVKLDPKSGAAVRWQAVSMAGGRKYASLALLLAARARGVAVSGLSLQPAPAGAWKLAGSDASWTLDHEGAVAIRFSPAGRGRPRYSLAAVRSGGVPRSAFAGKLVVVGPDLPKRDDNAIKTPVSAGHSKVELFADALATLLK